ncbi:MAG: hypothetical protein COW34_02180 [Armatimonadetes bacterium CG17_big_fil_post_rev_8_21_14_2_50_66_6]|nr:MAG: hypothetical protein COW34_02180 [Armatimonadetes bacterium CG17_big_fil_post_rev_8_21_14_2_50_66_6]
MPLYRQSDPDDRSDRACRQVAVGVPQLPPRRQRRALKEVVGSGQLGEVFHIEVTTWGYDGGSYCGRPDEPWRARKEVSGGALYDWGAHAIDWVLSLVPSRMTQVTGFFHKFREAPSNEDQTCALTAFA